ncbi:MAG: DUF6125 family protein [Thermodesulfobacteriota bacterium]
MRALETKQLIELLNKNWMTHDAMWFLHCMQECGMEKTNRINKAAVRAMGMIEAKRIAKALGVGKVQTFEDFKRLFEGAAELVMPDFMKFTYTFKADKLLHAEWQTCFAHEGISRIGAIAEYECGIFERIEAWLDALNIPFRVTPEVRGCMMHSEGQCYRDYELDLE